MLSSTSDFFYRFFLLLSVLVFIKFAHAQLPEIRDGGNYKIQSVVNEKFLTVSEQGIVGLRTGQVATLPPSNSMAQSWTLTWEPLREQHQGYWIESRKEYLNSVTAFYPPGRTAAETNVWRFKNIGDDKWIIQNTRTRMCLQVEKNNRRVGEGKCLTKDASKQQWNLIRVIVIPEEEEILFRSTKVHDDEGLASGVLVHSVIGWVSFIHLIHYYSLFEPSQRAEWKWTGAKKTRSILISRKEMQPYISPPEVGQRVNGAFAVLLTSDNYFIGVKVLQWSLKSVKSSYPLVVLYTSDTVSPVHVQKLVELGCILKETTHVKVDSEKHTYAFPYYVDTWTKLQLFNLTEYSRVVIVDADMLFRQNVDELMTLELPKGWIAASSGCLCNPMKVPTYPINWRPENCPYTYLGNGGVPGLPRGREDLAYFNTGLIVTQPLKEDFANLMNEMKRTEDLQKYVFPDQDFLNKVYAGRWICLPYSYNALRPLPNSHPDMWKDDEIKIVHYIFKKPWLDEGLMGQSEEERRKHEFYTVNSWWFQAYEKAQIESP